MLVKPASSDGRLEPSLRLLLVAVLVAVNPDQTGLTANVNVYTCMTSYLGNEQEMALVPPIQPGLQDGR